MRRRNSNEAFAGINDRGTRYGGANLPPTYAESHKNLMKVLNCGGRLRIEGRAGLSAVRAAEKTHCLLIPFYSRVNVTFCCIFMRLSVMNVLITREK